MTQAEFDALMPHEFWREVVDRVAAEVPGTLLLAEAFWLMEGYFVRTLGMHRVYNSAFMVMLRDEDNAKYRSVLKNTLEFDPDIMKRYVNFMSNPDERTAIDQFGTGDKYFGVATMMATLPGLPMFGHGQVEAFTEKYGMEYYKPRYNETPNEGLVERHQREIAPLLRERKLFAESGNFLLYDLWKENGEVDENVYAYSNRLGDRRAIVVFHNHYGETRGTIHLSAAFADKTTGTLRQVPLHDAIALPSDDSAFVAYRERVSGLEHLHRARDLRNKGLHLSLHAYQYRALLDWRELQADKDHPWDKLCDSLHGAGVPDLHEALIRLQLKPVSDALHAVLDPTLIRTMAELSELEDVITGRDAHVLRSSAIQKRRQEFFETICDRGCAFFHHAYRHAMKSAPGSHPIDEPQESAELAVHLRSLLRKVMRIPQMEDGLYPEQREALAPWSVEARRVLPSRSPRIDSTAVWAPALGWALLHVLAEWIETRELANAQPAAKASQPSASAPSKDASAADAPNAPTPAATTAAKPSSAAIDKRAIALYDQLRLRTAFGESFAFIGVEGEDAWRAAARIRVVMLPEAPESRSVKHDETQGWWSDADVRWLTGLHQSADGWYFNKESHQQMVWWSTLSELVKIQTDPLAEKQRLNKLAKAIDAELLEAERVHYRLRRTKSKASPPGSKAAAAASPAQLSPAASEEALKAVQPANEHAGAIVEAERAEVAVAPSSGTKK
jgi:hypothetical protein